MSMSSPNDWWLGFIDAQSSNNIELKRRTYTFFTMSYVGLATLLFFGFKNLADQNYLLLSVIFGCAFLLLMNTVYFHRSRDLHNCSLVGCLIAGCLAIMLVYQGGYQNTALYWIYPLPPIIFILIGPNKGLLLCSIILCILALFLLSPDLIIANYKEAEIVRFLASMCVLLAISFIGEYFREQSHSEMTDINYLSDWQANTDPLTHLANRRFIDTIYFNQIVSQPADHFPLSIVVCDVDHFKKVNDNHGHDVGDRVLVELALVLLNGVRGSDIVARTGGEEFLLLFPKVQLSGALSIAEKVRFSVEMGLKGVGHESLVTTMSFGVSCALTHSDIQSCIKSADERLYLAKSSGRNCVK
jgi:diguanylate cyclase (GGDEF)-like protein